MTARRNEALTRLAREEADFLALTFLAPVVFGRSVSLKIADVRCDLHVVPADYRGWGVFRPLSHTCAQVVRVPTAIERREYLDRFPATRLIVVKRTGDRALAIAANSSDERFDNETPFAVNLACGCDTFDTIIARHDGATMWFDQLDVEADQGAARYLRRALAMGDAPIRIARSGLTPAHRLAYAQALKPRAPWLGPSRRSETKLAPEFRSASLGMRM